MYFLVTTFMCAVVLVLLTKFISNMLNRFLEQQQKPFKLVKGKKLLRIEMNPQKTYSDWIADSNFIGFIKM